MKIPQIIKDQSGWGHKHTGYRVMRTITGGYRLYAYIGNRWMDASLNDNPDLSKYASQDYFCR
jgi:hypothetical protein